MLSPIVVSLISIAVVFLIVFIILIKWEPNIVKGKENKVDKEKVSLLSLLFGVVAGIASYILVPVGQDGQPDEKKLEQLANINHEEPVQGEQKKMEGSLAY